MDFAAAAAPPPRVRLAQVLKVAFIAFLLAGALFVLRPAYYSYLGSVSTSSTLYRLQREAQERAMEKERMKTKATDAQAKTSTRVSVPVPVVAQPSSSLKLPAAEQAGKEWEAIGAAKATQQSLDALKARVSELEQQLSVAQTFSHMLSDDNAELALAASVKDMAEEGAVGEAAVLSTTPPPPPVQEPELEPEPLRSPPNPPTPVVVSLPLPPPAAVSATGKSYRAEDHMLTAELIRPHTKDNLVMVTWANNHYYDFVKNWVYNLNKIGVTNFMVGAMDNELLKLLVDDNIPTFAMQSNMTTHDFGWGTKNFHLMGRKKIALIRDFTLMGFDILVSDVDTVWMRDPIPYLQKYPEADVLTSSDHLAPTATDGGLEHHQRAASPANIGIMLIRHTAKELTSQWVEVLKREDYWDQNAFNDLMRKGRGPLVRRPNEPETRLFKGFNGQLKIGILPVSMFCSGHTYFVQHMPQKYNLDPYVVHATFQFSGTEGKRNRMRESMLWIDPPEYHTRPGGYLVYDADVPKELIDNATTVEGHFDLVNFQIVQVRSAMALAQSLDRALIMPQLWCGFDRWWAPHSGKIPGSDLELPFQCPMDHVFEIEWMVRKKDANHFGKDIEFRESSFLDNPRTPAEVKNSVLKVELCDQPSAGCLTASEAAAAPIAKQLRIRKGLTDVQARAVFDQYKTTKVIQFTSMDNATWGGFEAPVDRTRFTERLRLSTGIWCCKRAHPGHIWYDMEFDLVPHKDRHNRVWDLDNPWIPTTGP